MKLVFKKGDVVLESLASEEEIIARKTELEGRFNSEQIMAYNILFKRGVDVEEVQDLGNIDVDTVEVLTISLWED